MPRVVVVAGPTAGGKSALAVAIAREFDGLVINADSQQRYRDLPLLTARPTDAELVHAPHVLFGDLGPDEAGSAAEWAAKAAAEIQGAGARLPIVVGGSGFYLQALIAGLSDIPAIPPDVRAAAHTLMADLGGEAFRARLAARDPAAAARLAAGDTQRLIRAWEVVEATDIPLSVWQQSPPTPPLAARYFKILLNPPRAELNAAIDARFVSMVARGAAAEVKRLLESGVARAAPVMRALGAPELAAYAAGETDLEAAVAAAQGASRRYAKRQATWFKHQFRADFDLETKYSERLTEKIFPKIRHFLLTTP